MTIGVWDELKAHPYPSLPRLSWPAPNRCHHPLVTDQTRFGELREAGMTFNGRRWLVPLAPLGRPPIINPWPYPSQMRFPASYGTGRLSLASGPSAARYWPLLQPKARIMAFLVGRPTATAWLVQLRLRISPEFSPRQSKRPSWHPTPHCPPLPVS